MARVHQRPASSRPARARSRAIGHRKRPYKVILESITQEKKKLYTVVRGDARDNNQKEGADRYMQIRYPLRQKPLLDILLSQPGIRL